MCVGPAYSLTVVVPPDHLTLSGGRKWTNMMEQGEYVQVKAQLIAFNADVPTAIVNSSLASLGLRPGMWMELVSFSTIPEEREDPHTVVGLGSWVFNERLRQQTGDSRQSLAYLPTPDKADFGLVPRMQIWKAETRFLGVAIDPIPVHRH